MTPGQKRNASLPAEVRSYLVDLNRPERDAYVHALRLGGWTLRAISEACGLTRERVRQLLEEPVHPAARRAVELLPVPELPLRAARPSAPPRPDVSPETLARLLELQPLAQQVRSNSKRYRLEAEEYTELLHRAMTVDGVTAYRLARRLGITHSAIRFRLMRYGYLPSAPGNEHSYCRPVRSDHRA